MINLEELSINELEKMLKLKKKESIKEKKLRSNQDLINEFLNSLNSENTKKSYKYALKKFITFLENMNLQLTTRLDFENYFDYLNNLDVRKKTKLINFAGVKSFFQYFIHKQNIDPKNRLNLHFIENPVTEVQRRWKNDREEKHREILTNDEINRVLQKLKETNFRHYMVFFILADTSMRGNGLVNIKIENIKLEKRIITTWDKGKMRDYICGLNLQNELRNYLLMRKRMNNVNDDKIHLFSSQKGTKLSESSFFSHVFPEIAPVVMEVTGKKITAHDLRRSFKTNRTNLGQLKEQVEALMNHKQGLDNAYNKPTHKMLLSWFDSYEEL